MERQSEDSQKRVQLDSRLLHEVIQNINKNISSFLNNAKKNIKGGKKKKTNIITMSEEKDKSISFLNKPEKITKRAKVLKTLGNCDVMENIASYLDIQDLGSLYETSHTLRMVSAFIFLVFICQYFYYNKFI